MTFYVGGTPTSSGVKCRIEFNHIHKGTRAGLKKLRPHPTLQGITSCIVTYGEIISVAHALCSHEDNFNRANGRGESLHAALQHPLILWQHRILLKKAWAERPRLQHDDTRQKEAKNGAIYTPELESGAKRVTGEGG